MEDLDYPVNNLPAAIQSFVGNMEINAHETKQEEPRNELQTEFISTLEATKASLFTLSSVGKKIYKYHKHN